MPRWAYWLVAILGILLIGAAGGHFVSPRTAEGEQILPEPPTETATVDDIGPTVMPDLIGLDVDTSRLVLSEYGVVGEVTTSTAQYAGPAGLVVSQNPAPGETGGADGLESGVELTLSAAAPMPDLAGKKMTEARDILARLGSVSRLEYVIRPGKAPGVIVDTEPAAGKPLDLLSLLTVTSAGDGLSLDQLDAVDDDRCESNDDQTTIGGQEVFATFLCRPQGPGEPAFVEYAVRNKAAYLDATLGLDDSGDGGDVEVRAIVDGNLIDTWTVTFGTAQPIRVLLTGALRLRLEVTTTSSSGDLEAQVVFGDAQLVGQPDDLAFLGSLQ